MKSVAESHSAGCCMHDHSGPASLPASALRASIPNSSSAPAQAKYKTDIDTYRYLHNFDWHTMQQVRIDNVRSISQQPQQREANLL